VAAPRPHPHPHLDRRSGVSKKEGAMSETTEDILTRLSDALARRVAAARPRVAAIRCGGRELRSGTWWGGDVIVASEQALPDRAGDADLVLAGGSSRAGRIVGRDPGTNIAVLRVDDAPQPPPDPPEPAAEPKPGTLVLALAADRDGGVAARFGAVQSVGPPWLSRAGGRIDHRIRLDIGLGRSEEGGPVLDAAGRLLGISTLGPRFRTLVIPTATVARVLGPLSTLGRVERGWLGAAVQPVSVPEALAGEAGQPSGLLVVGVRRDGPAARAGVVAGDILVGIDGAGVGSHAELARILDTAAVGNVAILRLIRGDAITAVEVTIGARPGR
jgi:S1-C subfamily serine protease